VEAAEEAAEATPTADPAPAPTGLSARVAELVAEHGTPGMSALAFDADGVLDRGHAGVRALGQDAAIGPDDRFHLGSCTKAMTATVMMRLAERGELDLDATLAEAFPDLTLDASWQDVTLWDLLRHRAGAPSLAPVQAPDVWTTMWTDAKAGTPTDQTRAAAASAVLSRPAPHPRGEFHYSNMGYVLAGAALEAAARASWEELMRRELFEPLGMTSCGFGPAGSAEVVDQPRGHKPGFTGPSPVKPGVFADNPPALGPAGTVHCALEDWAKFVRVHVGAGPEGYLSADALARLHAPPAEGDPYAAGWGVLDREGEPRALQHAGSNTMNYAVVLAVPEAGRGVLVAANAADPQTQEAVGQLVRELAEAHLDGAEEH
jgi:CubicO group peptidase (beta-lactamase class C family)